MTGQGLDTGASASERGARVRLTVGDEDRDGFCGIVPLNNPTTAPPLFGARVESRGRMYRCVATTLEGFVQQIATAYIPHGYWFYVRGRVPEKKKPEVVDTKLVGLYGVALSKWSRARRKQAGWANVQYLRFGRDFVVMATAGRHPFFEAEAKAVRDVRKVPIRIGGYSISARRGPDGRLHAHVRIDREPYLGLKAHFLEHALRWNAATLGKALYEMPFEPYAPVRRQYLCILRSVNKVRSQAGLKPLPKEVLALRRRILRALEPATEQRSVPKRLVG